VVDGARVEVVAGFTEDEDATDKDFDEDEDDTDACVDDGAVPSCPPGNRTEKADIAKEPPQIVPSLTEHGMLQRVSSSLPPTGAEAEQ